MDLHQQAWAEQMQADSQAVVLDVRTPEEWEDGIIPGALLLNFYAGSDFLASLEKLDKSKPYYVYCRSGGRSAQACHIMQQLGFSTTFNLLGGYSQWNGPSELPSNLPA